MKIYFRFLFGMVGLSLSLPGITDIIKIDTDIHHTGAQTCTTGPCVYPFNSPSISGDGSRIAFVTNAPLVSQDINNALADVYVWDKDGGIALVSTRQNINAYSVSSPSISEDGKYIVFGTRDGDLVSGDSNGLEDVFRYDIENDVTELVSVNSSEIQGNDSSAYVYGCDNVIPTLGSAGGTNSSMSADGRYVVFQSCASNLVSGDNHKNSDIFVRDTIAGTTEKISYRTNGDHASHVTSRHPSISADGRFVAFEASGGLDTQNNLSANYFFPHVYDRQTNTLKVLGQGSSLLSQNYGGLALTNDNAFYHARGDDDFTTYFSKMAIYGRALPVIGTGSNEIQRWSTADVFGPSVSSDGKFLVYFSAANITPETTGGTVQLYIENLDDNEVKLLSKSPSGVQGDADSGGILNNPHISADGCKVVFYSNASNLVANDTNGNPDIFLADNPFLPPWECGESQPVLNFVVDNNSSEVQANSAYVLIYSDIDFLVPFPGGEWQVQNTATGFIGNDYHEVDAGTNAEFIWQFTAEATGLYDFKANIPVTGSNTAGAVYLIEHASGEKSVAVDQSVVGEIWLAQLSLEAGVTYQIKLQSDAGASGKLVADAVLIDWVSL